jgi:hypothetical protein
MLYFLWHSLTPPPHPHPPPRHFFPPLSTHDPNDGRPPKTEKMRFPHPSPSTPPPHLFPSLLRGSVGGGGGRWRWRWLLSGLEPQKDKPLIEGNAKSLRLKSYLQKEFAAASYHLYNPCLRPSSLMGFCLGVRKQF